jgi:CRP-like cAMP-binding protein
LARFRTGGCQISELAAVRIQQAFLIGDDVDEIARCHRFPLYETVQTGTLKSYCIHSTLMRPKQTGRKGEMKALRVGSGSGNRIVGSLSRGDRLLLEPHLQPVTLKFPRHLESANRRIKTVYFIDHGLASVVALGRSERQQAEIAVVGREGMIGLAVILGVDRSPHDTFMQVEGDGRCITAEVLCDLMEQSRSLTGCLMRYAHAFSVQTGHTALANARGKIEERLSRWLLMAHDRLERDELHLTHEFLAVMLGVRRADVTAALHQLEFSALISTARGCVTVLDREGLEESANGLYGVPEAEFERLFEYSNVTC